MGYMCFKHLAGFRRWAAVFCFVAVLLLATKANAQVAGAGNIQGTVSDASGAVIPNATVTVTDVSTQVKHITKSDKAGVYVFPGLPVST